MVPHIPDDWTCVNKHNSFKAYPVVICGNKVIHPTQDFLDVINSVFYIKQCFDEGKIGKDYCSSWFKNRCEGLQEDLKQKDILFPFDPGSDGGGKFTIVPDGLRSKV